MDNYSNNNIEGNSNTNLFVCQEQEWGDCKDCELLGECSFWCDDEMDIDIESEEFVWYEMSYHKFVHRTVNFKHSELQ